MARNIIVQSEFNILIYILGNYLKWIYSPLLSLSGLVGSVKDLVPLILTAATRYWYHLPGPTSRTTNEVCVVYKMETNIFFSGILVTLEHYKLNG